MNPVVREFYESGSDTPWSSLIGQMDQVTYFNLSFAPDTIKISITCIRKEMDWIARILNEVIIFRNTNKTPYYSAMISPNFLMAIAYNT